MLVNIFKGEDDAKDETTRHCHEDCGMPPEARTSRTGPQGGSEVIHVLCIKPRSTGGFTHGPPPFSEGQRTAERHGAFFSTARGRVLLVCSF